MYSDDHNCFQKVALVSIFLGVMYLHGQLDKHNQYKSSNIVDLYSMLKVGCIVVVDWRAI